jgi:hypothetical protein
MNLRRSCGWRCAALFHSDSAGCSVRENKSSTQMYDSSRRQVVGSPRHRDLRAHDVYCHPPRATALKVRDRLVRGGSHRFFCFNAGALVGIAANLVAVPPWRGALTLGRVRMRYGLAAAAIIRAV